MVDELYVCHGRTVRYSFNTAAFATGQYTITVPQGFDVLPVSALDRNLVKLHFTLAQPSSVRTSNCVRVACSTLFGTCHAACHHRCVSQEIDRSTQPGVNMCNLRSHYALTAGSAVYSSRHFLFPSQNHCTALVRALMCSRSPVNWKAALLSVPWYRDVVENALWYALCSTVDGLPE